MNRPQTIQIFLTDGTPDGVREAEITNRLVKAIHFPRTAIEKASKRKSVKYTGVYFLFGEDENGNNKVYIGEGEICWNRILSHHREKDFWTEAVIAVTKTNILTKTEAKFLEHISLTEAQNSGLYITANDTGSKMPSIPESRKYDLLDNFETIKTLVGTLGFQMFKRIQVKSNRKEEFYYCSGKGIVAKGILSDSGIWVLKGSYARLKEHKTDDTWVVGMRKKLKSKGELVIKDDVLEFTKDVLFNSLSAAAVSILGRRANGWTEWKNKEGKTLDEIKRK
jgi:hypothetical protein